MSKDDEAIEDQIRLLGRQIMLLSDKLDGLLTMAETCEGEERLLIGEEMALAEAELGRARARLAKKQAMYRLQ